MKSRLSQILTWTQVKQLYEKVNERYGAEHIVEVIDSVDYGNVDGERVLKRALKLYKEKGAK